VVAPGEGQQDDDNDDSVSIRIPQRNNGMGARMRQNGFRESFDRPINSGSEEESFGSPRGEQSDDAVSTFDNSIGPNREPSFYQPYHNAESTITQGDVQTVISELVRNPLMINELIEALQKSGQGSMSLGGAPKRTRRRKAKRSKSAKKSR
jgi:hypothetical protein